MSVIRASDIGNYLYCRRAWWYHRQGYDSANQAELAAGTELHARHGRRVIVSGFLRFVGWLVFLAALVAGIFILVQNL